MYFLWGNLRFFQLATKGFPFYTMLFLRFLGRKIAIYSDFFANMKGAQNLDVTNITDKFHWKLQ